MYGRKFFKNGSVTKILFFAKTNEENSLVCLTKNVSQNIIIQDKGWKAFRVRGILDFSLVGILSKISVILADNKISIFAVSTYNTGYILVKAEDYSNALPLLVNVGYEIICLKLWNSKASRSSQQQVNGTRSTAGRHIQLVLQQLRREMEKNSYER